MIQGGYLDACTRKAPRALLENLERFLEELDALSPPSLPTGPAVGDPASQGMPAPFPGV